MKKRNKKNSAASLPEESKAPETVTPSPETDELVEDVKRALSEALASEPGAEEQETQADAAETGSLTEIPAPEPEELREEPEVREEPEQETEQVPPAEEAPAEAPQEKPKADSPTAAVLRITLPLTLICIVVALMLAVVNMLTADRIEANSAKEKENAVRAIFTQAEAIESLSDSGDAEVYLVTCGTEILGSCVSLSESGFGGAISMMVGMDSSGSVCGVRIVSMSETPGFGTRAKNESFLAGFRGSDPFVIGDNFDALSGATVTSKAVVAGVNRALELQPDLQAEAAQRGMTVAAAARTETFEEHPTETDPSDEEENPAETENVVAVIPPSPTEIAPVPEDTESAAYVNLAAVMPSETIVFRSASVNRVTVVSEETVYVSETEEPVETESAETEPVETEVVETEPVETEPVETEPVETEPVETEPVETEPVETEPVETEPVETEPVETEPVETEPVETEPVETESAETEPVETESAETEPVETEPAETESAETESAETEPVETRPVASGV